MEKRLAGSVLCSCALALVAFEGATRLLIRPCEACWGVLLGRELPPFRVISEDASPEIDRNEWFHGLVVNGVRITVGDLWGIPREDELLGYAPQEDTVSANGWWQSNNIGARSRYDIAATKPPSVTRVLAFGDSFTNCSRVPQEEAWTYYLDQRDENWEVINLGVDGYSMAQAYLRYRGIKNRIDHDLVI